jgi:methylmalonyl-CoA/ethylmalonyl-CoA epimerase
VPPQLTLDHVAVAVHSIKDAVRLYRDALGGEYLMGADEPQEFVRQGRRANWRWIQFRYPNGGKVELLQPLGDGFLTRFLERYGEGLHHVTFKADDIDAAIAHVESQGYELVDVNLEGPHWKEAFLRPSRAHGTLIQLAWSSRPDDEAAEHLRLDLEEVLDGD